MSTKKLIQLFLMTVIVLASFANVTQALAWGGCSGSYYVQWGDTLSGLASQCGTTVAAIRAANPNLGYWLYAGQVIYLPGASYGNYYGNNYGGYYGNNYGGYNGGYYGNNYGGYNGGYYGGYYGNNYGGYNGGYYGNNYGNYYPHRWGSWH